MAGVMLLFAFSMSLVINLIENKRKPGDDLNSAVNETEENNK